MVVEANYPILDEDFIYTLRLLRSAISKDGEFLNCPYDEDFKELIRQSFVEKRVSKFSSLTKMEKSVWLEKESADLYDELANLETDFRKLEVNERIQSIKTRQSLLEKLTSIQERGVNMQQMLQFQEEVMSLLGVVLTSEQLNDFLARIQVEGNEE